MLVAARVSVAPFQVNLINGTLKRPPHTVRHIMPLAVCEILYSER